MFKNKATRFALLVSTLNLVLYQYPFFQYVLKEIDLFSWNGLGLSLSLVVMMLVLNALVFYLLVALLGRWAKLPVVLFFCLNAVALYFVNTYHVLIDESMIGNVFNTNFEEAGSFFSWNFVLYLGFLGLLPSVLILNLELVRDSFKAVVLKFVATVLFAVLIAYANAPNWLWVDKHVPTFGSLVMPWSYTINTFRYHLHKSQREQVAKQLPDAKILDDEKAVVVLVIGESARQGNFSLYGYERETNPLLQKLNVQCYKASSCATYTRAGVKCILDYKCTDELFEALPDYLSRVGVFVQWRTTNTGEPHFSRVKRTERSDLMQTANVDSLETEYDELLLAGLEETIASASKKKIFIVMHTSTSHGPSYNKKCPERIKLFRPECSTVDLSKAEHSSLINAYDNTILYTDYLLASIIKRLKSLKNVKSSMIFVSDHGESLGEKNLYMHGLPKSVAPKEQYEIPFIIWSSEKQKISVLEVASSRVGFAKSSEDSVKQSEERIVSQHNVFHSVLDFLSVSSPIYDDELSLL